MVFLLDWLSATWRTLGWALSLDGRLADPLVPASGLTVESALAGALGVLLWAALSIGVGHAGVLFLNLVPVRRLAATFLVGVAVVLTVRAVEGVALWLVGWLVTGERVRPLVIIVAWLVALAPQVFAFLTALPHVGLFLGRLLSLWEVAILFVIITAVYRVEPWRGLVIVGVSWLALQLASRLLAGPLQTVANLLWTRASGRPALITPQDLLSGAPFVPVGTAKDS